MSSHGAKRKLCGWMVDAQPCETAAKPRETRAKRAKHPAKRPRNTRETSRNMRETQRILCEFDANPCRRMAAPRVIHAILHFASGPRGELLLKFGISAAKLLKLALDSEQTC